MAPPETFPEIENCIDLYVEAHDRYGTDVFEPDDLSRRSGSRGGDTGPPTDARSLTHLLDLLAAYGLLARHHDGRYRVRCAPEEDLGRWRENAVTRAESLYRRVHRTTGTSGDDATDDAGRETLRYDGSAFVSVRVTDAADLDSARDAIRTALDRHPDCAGLVVRSPGELATEVQRFADDLCGASTPATGGRTFEKEATDLVGGHKDDLEFRLFLRETT